MCSSDLKGGTATCSSSLYVKSPTVTTAVTTGSLINGWHQLVNVGWSFNVNDKCANISNRVVQVFSNEPDVGPGQDASYSPDAKLTNLPGTQVTTAVRVRSEQAVPVTGRVYLIVHTVTDINGHKAWSCSPVTVPVSAAPASVAAATAAGAAAAASCNQTGAAPAGYVAVGGGPVLGSYQ